MRNRNYFAKIGDINDIHTINNASRLIILYIKYIQFTTHVQFAFLGCPCDDDDQSTCVGYS